MREARRRYVRQILSSDFLASHLQLLHDRADIDRVLGHHRIRHERQATSLIGMQLPLLGKEQKQLQCMHQCILARFRLPLNELADFYQPTRMGRHINPPP